MSYRRKPKDNGEWIIRMLVTIISIAIVVIVLNEIFGCEAQGGIFTSSSEKRDQRFRDWDHDRKKWLQENPDHLYADWEKFFRRWIKENRHEWERIIGDIAAERNREEYERRMGKRKIEEREAEREAKLAAKIQGHAEGKSEGWREGSSLLGVIGTIATIIGIVLTRVLSVKKE